MSVWGGGHREIEGAAARERLRERACVRPHECVRAADSLALALSASLSKGAGRLRVLWWRVSEAAVLSCATTATTALTPYAWDQLRARTSSNESSAGTSARN